MPDYLTLKSIHMGAAVLSIAGFVLRYAWMIAQSPLLQARPTRILPHIVDTVLLASAILLAWMAGIAPWTVGWLGYKTIALIVYIVLGAIALKRGRTRGVRIAAGAAAIAVFASILWVARFKSLPFLAGG
ncbi:MAG TPA: SirB2 family protein [Burkholderiaceae bacterium]|nr:SirB2 family protein [Burkholderiaceae bacterium]